MADATHQPDQVVAVPDGAEFLRVADAVRDGDDPIAPVPIYAARPGDLVVVSDQGAGTYLGGGKMILAQAK